MSRQVSIILIDEFNKILLQHRDNIPEIWNPGAWSLFGGGVEEGETFEEALIRETKEELNYDLKNFEFIEEYTHESPVIVKLYISRIKNIEKESLKLLEGDDWGWFSLEETQKLDFGVGDMFWKWVKDSLEEKLGANEY
ncbi:MAG: NUDIX hydrolase [Candidatus Woesearchaeota archaeon]